MEFRPFFVLPPAFFVAEREASANNRGAARVTPKTVHMSTHKGVGAGARTYWSSAPFCSQRLFVFFCVVA